MTCGSFEAEFGWFDCPFGGGGGGGGWGGGGGGGWIPPDMCFDDPFPDPNCGMPPWLPGIGGGGGVWGGGASGNANTGFPTSPLPGMPAIPTGFPGNAGFPQIGGIPLQLVCFIFPLSCINTGGESGQTPWVIPPFPVATIVVHVSASAPSVQQPSPPSNPGQTGKYGDYLLCALGELANQGFGDPETAGATVLANVAPFALAEAPPLAWGAAGIAAIYDLHLAFSIRATCKQEVYGP